MQDQATTSSASSGGGACRDFCSRCAVVLANRRLHSPDRLSAFSVHAAGDMGAIFAERISGQPRNGHNDAGEFEEAVVDRPVERVSDEEAAEGVPPVDGAFGLPSFAVVLEHPSVLHLSADALRTGRLRVAPRRFMANRFKKGS